MGDRHYDVIILGSGITGSSIGYFLCRKGVTNILLLDKTCAGCGQTSMSSALIRLHYTEPVIREMAVFSWRFWRERFVDEVGCGERVFTETGVGFAGSEDLAESMEEVVSGLKRLGVDCELYDAEAFKGEVYPDIDIEGLYYVAWEPNSGHGDPQTSVNCFVKYVRETGGKVHEYEEVKKLVAEDNKVVEVITDKDRYTSDYVVNALGVWTNNVLQSIGITLPIKIGMEEVLIIKHSLDKYPPGWGDLALGFYSRPEGRSHQLIGGLDVEYPDIDPIPGYYSSPPAELVLKRMGSYGKRFPRLLDARPTKAWRGFYDITPDWQPIIGKDPRYNNLIHMVGLSGHGFKLAPAYGDTISDIIIHGDSRRFDVQRFSIYRFDKKESRHSKYKYGIVG